jgi:hypothetical protein
MNLLKPLLAILTFFVLSSNVFAQYDYPSENDSTSQAKQEKHKSLNSKILLGGSFGLMFGSYTYVEIDPIVGYKITPRLWTGLGPTYMYYSGDEISTSKYGIKVYGQFIVFKDLIEKIRINVGDIFIYAENEFANIEPIQTNPVTGKPLKMDRKWVDAALAGFGMRYSLGDRIGFSIFVLWDFTHTPYYSYDNPEIRIGFNF